MKIKDIEYKLSDSLLSFSCNQSCTAGNCYMWTARQSRERESGANVQEEGKSMCRATCEQKNNKYGRKCRTVGACLWTDMKRAGKDKDIETTLRGLQGQRKPPPPDSRVPTTGGYSLQFRKRLAISPFETAVVASSAEAQSTQRLLDELCAIQIL